MLSKRWGPVTWYLFHSLAYNLKNDKHAAILFNEIKSVCKGLPCPICRAHATKYISGAKVISKEELIKYLFEFHNSVNNKLNKKSITRIECDKLYEQANVNKIMTAFETVYKSSQELSLDSVRSKAIQRIFIKYIQTHRSEYNKL